MILRWTDSDKHRNPTQAVSASNIYIYIYTHTHILYIYIYIQVIMPQVKKWVTDI